ncbi:MAG: hypothetical protein J7K40_14715 [candidate division Zixibacteria bacterium]|nr:hypothetical protein [candidate division Zixibacteria bacterium]
MSKNMTFAILTIFLCIGIANTQAGNDMSIGARGEGLGFSYSALADEPFGALYNPAGPGYVQGWQAQLQYYMPTSYGYLVDESPYGGLLGLNYFHEKYGNIVFNTHQFGSFSDPTSLTTSTNINLAYSRLLNDEFSAGAGFKYVFESNQNERSAFDIDVGLSWRSKYNLSLAAVGENLLKSKLTPDQLYSTEYLSRKFRFAGAYFIPMTNNLGSVLAGWQLEQAGVASTHNTSQFNFGTEWWIATNSSITMGLRAGYTIGKTTVYDTETDLNRWSAGFSLNFDLHGRDFRFDYAIRSYPFESPGENLVADNFISFSYGWGGVPDYYSKHEENNLYDFTSYQMTQPSPIIAEPEIAAQISEPEQPLLQTTEEPIQIVEAPMPPPITAAPSPPPTKYKKLNLNLNYAHLNIGNSNRLVFYLKPEGFLNLSSWKLYIFSAKLKDWSETAADSYALHSIGNKGLPPLNVVWDGKLASGQMIRPGKYFFIVMGIDQFGQKSKTKWVKFKVE